MKPCCGVAQPRRACSALATAIQLLRLAVLPLAGLSKSGMATSADQISQVVGFIFQPHA
jgi:hypothetical protein